MRYYFYMIYIHLNRTREDVSIYIVLIYYQLSRAPLFIVNKNYLFNQDSSTSSFFPKSLRLAVITRIISLQKPRKSPSKGIRILFLSAISAATFPDVSIRTF